MRGEAERMAPAKICGHVTKRVRSYCPDCRQELYSKTHHVPCLICGKIMTLSASEAKKYKCCSMACRNKNISIRQSGEKSHLWRGGVSSEDKIKRNSAEYDSWRRQVFERDGYKCTVCGTGGKLCADHIKEWFLYPALRFDVSNGRTLCWPCHRETDSFGGRSLRKRLNLEKNGVLQYMLL